MRLFQNREALSRYIESEEFEVPVDGVTLLQQYIESPEKKITRSEFVGGKFLYAVNVDTSEGFELCPADACSIDDLACPAGETPSVGKTPRFVISSGPPPAEAPKYEAFLRDNGIEIAGIELVTAADGTTYTYDVNTNTNYNAEAEASASSPEAEIGGMGAIATFLGDVLRDAAHS